ncbi:MAG: gpW family head-tail joining protein [Dokdonella sp.]|uniref:gpW family head-tail joining protein n=1 Tax=Dokdonella sp. TaxID=2291710 RepID=UPI003F7FCB6B
MSCRPSILDGIDVTTLQQRLALMQQAWIELTSGAKVEVASYSQSDGSRTITYTKANLGDLVAAITTVQTQIDLLNGLRSARRAPMRPLFR